MPGKLTDAHIKPLLGRIIKGNCVLFGPML